MDLHTIVKSILLSRDKTQKQLSEDLGYSQVTVLNNILTGGNPRLNTLLSICEALGCKLAIRDNGKVYEITKKQK